MLVKGGAREEEENKDQEHDKQIQINFINCIERCSNPGTASPPSWYVPPVRIYTWSTTQPKRKNTSTERKQIVLRFRIRAAPVFGSGIGMRRPLELGGRGGRRSI